METPSDLAIDSQVIDKLSFYMSVFKKWWVIGNAKNQ